MILSHVGLRRLRKGLLSDLSMLVRIAKELQFAVQNGNDQTAVFEQLDELVLKAFKVVERAVRFHDIWSQDVDNESAAALSIHNNIPPTPPMESTVDDEANAVSGAVHPTNDHLVDEPSIVPRMHKEESPALDLKHDGDVREAPEPAVAALDSGRETISSDPLSSRPLSVSTRRMSIAHRLSYLGNSGATAAQKQNLASERLSSAHDSFMSLLGTFIGLHISSRSSHELATTTHKSVVACRELITVVEEIWARDGRRLDSLKVARDVMYAKLAELVSTAKEMLNTAENEEDILKPDQESRLVMTTTNCILAAGDCVNKARQTIERIGDFESESSSTGLADQIFDNLSRSESQRTVQSLTSPTEEPISRAPSVLDKPLPIIPGPPELSIKPPLPPISTSTKPLPEPPLGSPSLVPEPVTLASLPEEEPEPEPESEAGAQSTDVSVTPQPTLSPRLQAETSPVSPNSGDQPSPEFGSMPRTDSVNTSVASAADIRSTWRNSVPDGASIASRPSTRATTPESSPVIMMNSVGSVCELQSVASEELVAEEQVLERTFAHELIPSKDGQVLGGSLAALIERLTTHDSTPDATFVTTFYLTFRLFTTAQQLAQGLVERFEYIGESPSVGIPVRLRIYNVFKGWLETHWHQDTDAEVLPFIVEFARNELTIALPSAGKRILELTQKVAEQRNCALVPRLVSSLGRFSTTIASFSTVDSGIPTSVITKSQLNALRQARIGGTPCSVLDFDPLEIARQFTIIESRLYCSISPEELLNFEYTKKSEARVVNVLAMSTLATDLANLVAESILQYDEPKKRAVMIKQWIKISMKCLELANYDTLMAIICSINSSVIIRLRKTWDLVSQKNKNRLEELSAMVDCTRNHSILRERLKHHVAPCIPYVGMYLTDLTFTHVGNPPTRELPGVEPKRHVVNFDRCMKIAKTIGEVQRFQIPYRLAAVPELQEWIEMQVTRISRSEGANTQAYYRRSLLLEPRETASVQPRGHWYNAYGNSHQQQPISNPHHSAYQPMIYQSSHQPHLSQTDVNSTTNTDANSSKESIGGKEKFDFQAN